MQQFQEDTLSHLQSSMINTFRNESDSNDRSDGVVDQQK